MSTPNRAGFIGFDIETRPIPEAVLKFTDPFPPFNAEDVKTGNIKDPVKIAEKIEAERQAHARAAERYHEEAQTKAALHPFTGAIVVIGLINQSGAIDFIDGPEKHILSEFWRRFGLPGDLNPQWVMWSGNGASDRMFDVDFIVTRSRILGVPIPRHVRPGRYYTDRITDLASEFLLHRRDAYCSLTKAAELFALYDKPHESPTGEYTLRRKSDADEVRGENFWLYWTGDATAHAKAREYLTNDLRHLLALAPHLLA